MAFDSDLLRELCLAPAPTGFEGPVQQVLRRRFSSRAEIRSDPLGNLLAAVGPADGPGVLVAAHADQIGLIVTFVDEHGFIFFQKIGGVDQQVLPGRDVVIHAAGGPVVGVVGRRPVHLTPKEDQGKAPEIHEQFIDIGAVDRAAALERVTIGDPVTFAPRFIELAADTYATLAADDRAGVYVAARALELYAADPGSARFIAFSTVQEETTSMGARAQTLLQRPAVVVVVDVDFATDHPGMDAKKAGGEVKLGGGPVLFRGIGSNHRLFDLVREVAAAEDVELQVKASPGRTSTDADELMATAGAATLSLSIPLRYMHSPFEVVRGSDMEAAATLLAALARRIGEESSPQRFVL